MSTTTKNINIFISSKKKKLHERKQITNQEEKKETKFALINQEENKQKKSEEKYLMEGDISRAIRRCGFKNSD